MFYRLLLVCILLGFTRSIKRLSGCSPVVAVLRVKIGLFWCCCVTLQQLLSIHVDVSDQEVSDNIQVRIDAAVDADTVVVGPEEYAISEPITFRGKAISVRSEAGPDETTIRMGKPADPDRASVVIFEKNETAESVPDGFTITYMSFLSMFVFSVGFILLFYVVWGIIREHYLRQDILHLI